MTTKPKRRSLLELLEDAPEDEDRDDDPLVLDPRYPGTHPRNIALMEAAQERERTGTNGSRRKDDKRPPSTPSTPSAPGQQQTEPPRPSPRPTADGEDWTPVATRPRPRATTRRRTRPVRNPTQRATGLLDRLTGPRTQQKARHRTQETALETDANVESNVGILGLGGTGCRVSSQVFAADPEAPGLGKSFGFDLDADENVPRDSRLYEYTLITQTGGIPAAGIFSFSEMVADSLLLADTADLGKSAARFQGTIQRAVEASLYNVTLPVFSAGGGVGHGLYRAVDKAVEHGRSLTVPLIVQPSSRQPVPIRISAAASLGQFVAQERLPLVMLLDNDRLERRGFGQERHYRNSAITQAFRITGAAIDFAFHRGEADGNIDRALLNLARGSGTTTGTLGTASEPAYGDGAAAFLNALSQAVQRPLAQLEGGRKRLMVFAVVPEKMDVEHVRGILESSVFNQREHGYELVGAFLGRARSYTCDVSVWMTGEPRLPYIERIFHDLSSSEIEEEIQNKVLTGQTKLEKAFARQDLASLVGDRDPHAYLDAARHDMERGLEWYRRRWRA